MRLQFEDMVAPATPRIMCTEGGWKSTAEYPGSWRVSTARSQEEAEKISTETEITYRDQYSEFIDELDGLNGVEFEGGEEEFNSFVKKIEDRFAAWCTTADTH